MHPEAKCWHFCVALIKFRKKIYWRYYNVMRTLKIIVLDILVVIFLKIVTQWPDFENRFSR